MELNRIKIEYSLGSSFSANIFLFLFFTVLFTSSETIYCQETRLNHISVNNPDTSRKIIYSLNNGDYWVYEIYMQYDVLIDIETRTVIYDTTLPNLITYKKILKRNLYVSPYYSYYLYERIDTNENIYHYSFDNTLPLNQRDQLYLKLSVEVGDTFKADTWGNIGYWLVEDIWYDSLGKNILFYWDYLTQTYLFFSEIVGLYEQYEEGGVMKLRGAYLNDILIGDTSTVKKKNYISDEPIACEFNYIGNYPNPFNFRTTITYTISWDSNISLCIYDIGGKLIKILDNSFKMGGNYNIDWNGFDENNNMCPTGLYIIYLKTNYGHFTNKMILLK